MSTQSLGSLEIPSSCSGVDDGGLDDAVESVISLPFTEADDLHVTILEELSDTRSRVGLSDLGGLLGVEPDCGVSVRSDYMLRSSISLFAA